MWQISPTTVPVAVSTIETEHPANAQTLPDSANSRFTVVLEIAMAIDSKTPDPEGLDSREILGPPGILNSAVGHVSSVHGLDRESISTENSAEFSCALTFAGYSFCIPSPFGIPLLNCRKVLSEWAIHENDPMAGIWAKETELLGNPLVNPLPLDRYMVVLHVCQFRRLD